MGERKTGALFLDGDLIDDNVVCEVTTFKLSPYSRLRQTIDELIPSRPISWMSIVANKDDYKLELVLKEPLITGQSTIILKITRIDDNLPSFTIFGVK
jgi:hypothetical protein